MDIEVKIFRNIFFLQVKIRYKIKRQNNKNMIKVDVYCRKKVLDNFLEFSEIILRNYERHKETMRDINFVKINNFNSQE